VVGEDADHGGRAERRVVLAHRANGVKEEKQFTGHRKAGKQKTLLFLFELLARSFF